MSVELVRRYVRLVVEAAYTVDTAPNQLAFMRRNAGGKYVSYVLYDPSVILNSLDDFGHEVPGTLIEKSVLGYIQIKRRDGDCNNASQIVASVARKGYGPFIYDLVMSDCDNGLMPDRNSVSSSAQNVWKRYEQRSDVEQHPFDDMDDPKTPDPSDDCYLYGDTSLDASYTGSNKSGSKEQLFKQHQSVIQQLENVGCNANDFEAELSYAGNAEFDRRVGH